MNGTKRAKFAGARISIAVPTFRQVYWSEFFRGTCISFAHIFVAVLASIFFCFENEQVLCEILIVICGCGYSQILHKASNLPVADFFSSEK